MAATPGSFASLPVDASAVKIQQRKPRFAVLRELQREFLQLRWCAISSRGEQAKFSRTIDTHVVTHALGLRAATDAAGSHGASADSRLNYDNLPSAVISSAFLLSSAFLFADAASCGMLARRRKFRNFGDGMISYDRVNGASRRSSM